MTIVRIRIRNLRFTDPVPGGQLIAGYFRRFLELIPLVEAETPAQTTEEQEENGADVDIASSKPVGPLQCFGSGSAWIRIDFGRLDPNPEICGTGIGS